MVVEDCNVSGGLCGLGVTAAADVSIRRSVLSRAPCLLTQSGLLTGLLN